MRSIKLGLFFLFTSLCYSLGAQQPYTWKQATSNGYTYKYVTNDPMKTRFYTLKNGLSVILSANHKEPRITYRLAVRTGSNNDPSDHTGLAHYLEHLLFKGTDKYGSLDWAKEKPLLDRIEELYEQYISTTDSVKRKEIYKEIDKVSGEAAKFSIAGEYTRMMTALGSQGTNAHTSVEETIYEEDFPSNAIDKFLAIQAERLRQPVFRIFHTELEAVYEEKNRGLDNDGNKMQEAMFSTVFPTHNYGLQTTIGTIEHLKNPSIKAIREYYYKYYVPNNMAIVMAGDFDPDEMIQKITKEFAYLISKPVQEYKGPVEKPIAGPIVKEVFGPSAESVRILFRSAPSGTREALLADLLRSILSNGKAGLIDLNLNKQQKVLGAGAALWQFKDNGIFFLLASPKQGQTLEEVKELLLTQIDILKKGDFDESLIKAIVSNYKLGELQALENNTSRAGNIADEFIKNRGTEWNSNVAAIDEMSKVTKKELVDFANKLLTNNNFVILYKRKGEDKNIAKVEKPAITPVETNAGKASPFVKAVIETPLPSIKPVWIDYNKDLKKEYLGNAEVLYVQNKDNGLFRLTYRFDMGSWNNKLLPIAAQYIQYLGTDKYSSEELSKEFYNLACNFNINSGTEVTTLSVSGLQENFEKAVGLFEHLINNCRIDEAALTALKNNILKSRANSKLNKNAISSAMQSYAMYGAKNPFNYVLTDAELQDLKAEDLTNLLHTLSNFQHTITYYGPILIEGLLTSIKKIHKLPATWSKNNSVARFEKAEQTNNTVLFADYDAVQSEIYWIKNLDVYDSKSEPVVNLFNSYFGGDMGSIVFQTIRESKALAYSTYAFVMTPSKKDDKFSMVAYVGSQADKMNDAVKGMNELLNEMPKSDQNFENARTSLLKNIETDRVTQDGIILNYLNAKRKGLDHDIRKDNYSLYKTLLWNDIYKYHQQEFVKQPYTYCVVASEKRINLEDLKKYGELKILNLTELFGY
ncbi:MAG TPA: insulinase family protein [Chitinophagaceae bacterium]|nr:insulinase family protein [Chitinophagaceae bacterium]HQZ75117.1 insulinase family protein [Chitinophagaceae bacterium]